MAEKRAAKKKEIKKRKEELESHGSLQNQYFDQLISRVQKHTFLSSIIDMNMVTCLMGILEDCHDLNTTQYEFLIPFLPLISWQLAHVDMSWALLQPQNNYQQIEHITTTFLRFSSKMIKSLTDNTFPDHYFEGINHYITFKQLYATIAILCGHSDDFSYVEILQLFTEHQNLCYPLYPVSESTTELMELALEGILSETSNAATREKISEASPAGSKTAIGALLHDAVAGVIMFEKVVNRNQMVFIWELLAVGGVMKYCEMIVVAVDKIAVGDHGIEKEQQVGKVLRLIRRVLGFIIQFERIEPTCVGDVVDLMNGLVLLHEHLCMSEVHVHCDYLCESLFQLSNIIGDCINNPIVQINMQAYVSAKLFGSLFSKDMTLTKIIQAIEQHETVPLPCLHATALAFTFSRAVFTRLDSATANNTATSTASNDSTYKNLSRISCTLEVYSNTIDVLVPQSLEYLVQLILAPNGLFLDTLFSLLLTSFIGVGYEEAIEKKRLKAFDISDEIKTYEKFNVDYELPRIVALYLAVHVFADTSCKALKVYVKQYFTRQHIDSLWLVLVAQSPRTSLNNDNSPPFGPLISDVESITNLRVLLKQLVTYRHITDANLQIILEKRRNIYPLIVPVELAVFIARLWIHRISYIDALNDDPVAIKEWDSFLYSLSKLISQKEPWKGEELIGYETICTLLFIFHNLSHTTRIVYLRKMFDVITNAPKNISPRGVVGLTRALLILDYMLRFHNDFSSDLLEELKKALIARSFEEHGSLMHDTCIIPPFIEKLNFNDALFSFAVETHSNTPANGFIRFYAFTKFETYEAYLTDLRLGMHYPIGSVVMLTESKEYAKCYDQLIHLLSDCSVATPKDPTLLTASFMLNEYFFDALWRILCVLPPPQHFIDKFKDKHLFTSLPIGNTLLHYVNWLTNLCYLTDKQKSKFYKEVDIGSIRVKHHLTALYDILKKITTNPPSGIRIDAIVQMILQFFTCSTLNSKYLDLYRIQLRLRKAQNEEALKIETLTQSETDKKKFEKSVKELKEAERIKKTQKAEKEKKKATEKDRKKELKTTEKLEKANKRESAFHGIKNILKKDSKSAKISDAQIESLQHKVVESDARRKRKILKKRVEWAEPVDAPDKLNESVKSVIYKNTKEFFQVIGDLLKQYFDVVKTQQLGGMIMLDRGIIIDLSRKNDVNWKKDAIANVLFEGVNNTSLISYIQSLLLTDETLNFITNQWGSKLYLWKDEFFHPLQHMLDAGVSCPLRQVSRAYFSTVSSTQKIVKSIITLSTLISIQAQTEHLYESSSLMNTLLFVIPDKSFMYTQERAVELALRLGSTERAQSLIQQAKLYRGDQFLRFVLQRSTIEEGTVSCVLDCLEMMIQAVQTMKTDNKHSGIEYYQNNIKQLPGADLKLYLLVGGKVKNKRVLQKIEEFLGNIMKQDEQLKKINSVNGACKKILGTEENGVFVESGDAEVKELFNFFSVVVGNNEQVQNDVMEKMIESIPLVVEQYGDYIQRYFTVMVNYVAQHHAGSILIDGIAKWFQSITFEKIKILKECAPFAQLLAMVDHLFCQIKESVRSTGDSNYLPFGKQPIMQRMYSVLSPSSSDRLVVCSACKQCCFESTSEIVYLGVIEKSCQCQTCKCKKRVKVDDRKEIQIAKNNDREMARLYEIETSSKQSTIQLSTETSDSIETALLNDDQLGKYLFEFFTQMSTYLLRASVDEISYYDTLFTFKNAIMTPLSGKFISREYLTREQLLLVAPNDLNEYDFTQTNILTRDAMNRLCRVMDECIIVRGGVSFTVDYEIKSLNAHPRNPEMLLVTSNNIVSILSFDTQTIHTLIEENENVIIHKTEWLSNGDCVIFTNKFVRLYSLTTKQTSKPLHRSQLTNDENTQNSNKELQYETVITTESEEYTTDAEITSGVIIEYSDKQYLLLVANQNGDVLMNIIQRPIKQGRFKILTQRVTRSFQDREIIAMNYLVDIDAVCFTTTQHVICTRFDSISNSFSKHITLPNFTSTIWCSIPLKRSFYVTYSPISHETTAVLFNNTTISTSIVSNKPIAGLSIDKRLSTITSAFYNDAVRAIDYIDEVTTTVQTIKSVNGNLENLQLLSNHVETDNAFVLKNSKKVYYNRLFVTSANDQYVISAIRLHFKQETMPIRVLIGGRQVSTPRRGSVITVFLSKREMVEWDPRVEIVLHDCVVEEHLSYPSKIEVFGKTKVAIGFNELKLVNGLRLTNELMPLRMPIHDICKTALILLLRYFELNASHLDKQLIKNVQDVLIQKVFEPTSAAISVNINSLLRYLSTSLTDLKHAVADILLREMSNITVRHPHHLFAMFILKSQSLLRTQPNYFTSEKAQTSLLHFLSKIHEFITTNKTLDNPQTLIHQSVILLTSLYSITKSKELTSLLIQFLSIPNYSSISLDAVCTVLTQPLSYTKQQNTIVLATTPLPLLHKQIIESIITTPVPQDPDVFLRICQILYMSLTAVYLPAQPENGLFKSFSNYLLTIMKSYQTTPLLALHSAELIRSLIRSLDQKVLTSFNNSLKTFADVNFTQGLILYPSMPLGNLIATELDATKVQDIFRTMLSHQVTLIPTNEATVISPQHHSIPLYKTTEVHPVDFSVDLLQTMYYLQSHYRRMAMELIDSSQWKDLLEQIIVLEGRGDIPRGVVSKRLLYELSGSSHLYHQATDKKHFNKLLKALDSKDKNEVTSASQKSAKIALKRPSNWQLHCKEQHDVIGNLLRWIQADISLVVTPCIQLLGALFTNQVSQRDNMGESEKLELIIVNDQLKKLVTLRPTFIDSIITTKGIAEVIRLTAYAKNQDVRILLKNLFVSLYRDANSVQKKRLWGYFWSVLEHPQADTLNQEFITTLKIFTIINENNARDRNVALYF
ncbi:Uncharacterized protein QTN25_006999 [Entamoeba marina]